VRAGPLHAHAAPPAGLGSPLTGLPSGA
jgi:hypothetical protein